MAREDKTPKDHSHRGPGKSNGGYANNPAENDGGAGDLDGGNLNMPGTTGRYLVLFREDAVEEGVALLREASGLSVASTLDSAEGVLEDDQLAEAGMFVFDKLGVAVVDTPPEQMSMFSAAMSDENSPVLMVEPERIVYALDDVPYGNAPGATLPVPSTEATMSADYLYGYRDAVDHLIDKILGNGHLTGEIDGQVAAALDESQNTWGLQATGVVASRFSGKGIRVAVLDTGFDLGHPDFLGRTVVTRSFIPGQAVQDGNGHGTHCIGTACGPRQPGQLPRYGISYQAEIYAGKVLSNGGSGSDSGILAGINWAMTNRCQVVSMSLGARVVPGQSFSRIFEIVASRALAAGTLIVAAAGNDSSRPGVPNPVSHPANCPSIMSVGALDSRFRIASFSNGGVNPNGGQVDIAGPGVNVRSSWPRPALYNTISGTSMATPHVAGIAALYAEANPRIRGRALWQLVVQHARRLALPARDVGAGLVQAP